MTKNKVHGTISAFLSIVSYSTSSRRILIDYSTQSTAFVCHLKARTVQDFEAWIEVLKQHRLYYQYKCLEQSSYGHARHSHSSQIAAPVSTASNQNPSGSSGASSNTISSKTAQSVANPAAAAASLSSSVGNRDSLNYSSSVGNVKPDASNEKQSTRFVFTMNLISSPSLKRVF
jgi:hypothetical protein